MVETAALGIVSKAGNKVLSNLVDDVYTHIKGKAALRINKRSIDKKIPALVRNINNVRLVKTLWQIDYAVDVETFYCDSYLLLPTKTRNKYVRRKIINITSLGKKNNYVIKGTAGQGKSILLRHLFVKELELGQRIPIFIELRRIQRDETLLEHINRFFNILDLTINVELFKILSKSGKFIFFLDGFDEISQDNNVKILTEIEYLTSLSTESHFIVTTRPDTAIEMSPAFNLVTLDNLKGDEYKKVIRKLATSSEYSQHLITAIKNHRVNISDLLCTPLLITLLLISYSSYQTLPEQLSDFYDQIFPILLRRHDGSKPGFTRPRSCSINDTQYREVFDAFCFYTKKQPNPSFSHQDAYKLVRAAMSLVQISEDPECYISDLQKITCLLLEESNEYHFIHRSVQEYYASSFIRNRPESNSESFYSTCLNWGAFNTWEQELMFLSETDRYRYYKYYLLPLCRLYLNADSDDTLLNSLPPTQNMLKITHGFCLTFAPDSPRLNSLGTSEINQILRHDLLFNLNIIPDLFDSIDYTELVNLLFEKNIRIDPKPFIEYHHVQEKHAKERETYTTGTRIITIQQAIDAGFSPPAFTPIIQRIADHIYGIWQMSHSYIKNMESFDISSQLPL